MKKLLILCLFVAGLVLPASGQATALDFDVAGGHFFTQTGSADGTLGFLVIDDARARFWTEFKRLGGVDGVGYPLSQRFVWDGFVVQVMQKGVLQWRPELGRAYFVNVFDQLGTAGKDGWLVDFRSTPRPLDSSFDAGKSWAQIMAARLALLDANPAIKARYFAVSDPLNQYGLPTSRVIDNGNHFAIRLQRAVIQQWKVAVPWAALGQVTVANGGDVGKEAALYPAASLEPVNADGAAPSSRGGRGSPQQIALDAVNLYRTLAGATPLSLNDALNRSTAAHANYYVLNYGDPSLAGMGLHKETLGRPGFTGVSWENRASAAGYRNWAIDENVGVVGNPQRTVDWFMGTVGHRWNLLSPSAVHLGYGISTKPGFDVFDIGFSSSRPAVALPVVFPGDGQQDVPVTSDFRETPDPLPGIPRPLGYPVTIGFHVSDKVTFGDYSMMDHTGQAIPLYTAQKSWLRALALVPKSPLRAAESYTVRVSGTVNGAPFTKTWSFRTH